MKNKVMAMVMAVLLLLSAMPAAMAQDAITVTYYDTKSNDFYTTGAWSASGALRGYNDCGTIYSVGEGVAGWAPELLFGGTYRVSIWNVVHSENVDKLLVRVTDKNGTQEFRISHKTGEAGFVELGEFEFAPGKGTNKVEVVSETKNGFARVGCMKLEMIERGESISVDVPMTGEEQYESYSMRSISAKDVALPELKADAVRIYVSSGASGDGSEENPFGTLQQAQQKVRQLIAEGYPEAGIGVIIKAGTYSLDDSFTLTQEDSGTQQSPVIWQAEEGQSVTLTGGKVLNPEIFQPISEEEIRKKIPESARDHVYVADLSQAGLMDIPKMDLINSVPYVLANGEKAGMVSRWPNSGFGRTGKIIDTSSRSDSGPRKKGFTYEISDARQLRWKDAQDVWLNGYWMTPYTINYARLADLDTDQMRFSGKEYNDLGAYGTARYFVQNLLEEIDQEGEWYLDNETNLLYWYPFAGWEQEDTLFACENFDIVKIDGASNLVLKNINYEVAGGNGITISPNSTNCGVIGGQICNVSGVGAQISGQQCFVRDCDITATGLQGIQLEGGAPYQFVEAGNYAENNVIHDVGTGGGAKQGISIAGCGNRISHNHIYNTPTQGIAGGGLLHTIEYNVVERTNLEMGDTGGIYIWDPSMGYGTTIRYNLVRDSVGVIEANSLVYAGVMGIYLDNATSGFEVYGNVVMNVKGNALFSNAGRENHFYNNIVISGDIPVSIAETAGVKSVIENKENMKLYDLNNEKFLSMFPRLENVEEEFESGAYAQPRNNVVENNVAFQSGPYSCASVTKYDGQFENNISIDSLPAGNLSTFEDFDYSQIKSQIPDFEEIPFQDMGIYTGGARQDTSTVVFDNRAEAFLLTYPENGAQDVDPNTKLEWQLGKGGISGYNVYIAEDAGFEHIVDIISANSEGSCETTLDYGKTYYWRAVSYPVLGYEQRWNENGVFQFTTISLAEKLNSELFSAKHLLEITEDQQRVPQSAKTALTSAIASGEAARSGDEETMKQAVEQCSAAIDDLIRLTAPDTENLQINIFDSYQLDTIGERPLGLFLRSYSALDGTVQQDPWDEDNKVVRFLDEHQEYHYADRFFESQDGYVEAGTKVLAEQTNGAFSVSLMRTGYYPVEAGVIENIAAKVAFSTDGKIYAGKDKAIELMPYEANTWYSVKIMLNLKEKTYDVEINGELKATGVPMNNPQVEEVNQIVFDTTDGTPDTHVTTGTYYFDDTIVRIPGSEGKNPYLMSLSVNSEELDDFEPGKFVYRLGMDAQELEQAQLYYQGGSGASIKEWSQDGVRYITVYSADWKKSSVYLLK